jgi:hypothetical protein
VLVRASLERSSPSVKKGVADLSPQASFFEEGKK